SMIWRGGHLLWLAVRPDHFAGCQGVHSRYGGVQVAASTTVFTVAVLPVRALRTFRALDRAARYPPPTRWGPPYRSASRGDRLPRPPPAISGVQRRLCRRS